MANPIDPLEQMLMKLRGISPGVQSPNMQVPYPMDEVPRPNVQVPQAPETPATFGTSVDRLGVPEPFKPSNVAQDQFMQQVSNMPQRNKPGKGRRIAGIIAGIAGGPETTESILYAPYRRDMRDWATKTDVLGKAATLENQDNTSGRLIQSDYYRARLGATRENRLADLQQWKIDHPTHQLRRVEKNGQMRWELFDPTNPTVPPVDTGRIESEITDFEAINYNNQGRVAAAEAGRAIDPNSQKIQQYIRAMQLANSDPRLASIIRLGDPGSGSFTMDEPGNAVTKWLAANLPGAAGKVFDESDGQQLYRQALEFIYGTGPNPSSGSNLPAPPAAQPGTGAITQPNVQPQGAAPSQMPQAPSVTQPFPQQEVTVPNPRIGPAQSAPQQAEPNFRTSATVPAEPAQSRTPVNVGTKITRGSTPPPREQRKLGDIHTWPDGSAGIWKGGPNWEQIQGPGGRRVGQ